MLPNFGWPVSATVGPSCSSSSSTTEALTDERLGLGSGAWLLEFGNSVFEWFKVDSLRPSFGALSSWGCVSFSLEPKGFVKSLL